MADEIYNAFRQAFRYDVTDGVPSSGLHKPTKSEIIEVVGRTVQARVDAVASTIADETAARETADNALAGEITEVRQIAETGLKPMLAPVRVLVTSNVNISNALENGDTLDGLTLATGDRVALAGQSTAHQNGIYVVVASGAASRASDADTSSELIGARFEVSAGTRAAEVWGVRNTDPITVGTTAITIGQMLTANPTSSEIIAARGLTAPTLGGRIGETEMDARAAVNLAARTFDFTILPSQTIVATTGAPGTIVATISGGLRLAPTSATGAYAISTPVDLDVGTVEVDFTYTTESGSSSRGLGIAVGEGADRKWYTWSPAGTFVQRSQANAVDLTVAVSASAALVFSGGQSVGVAVTRNADGTGLLTATLPNGDRQSYGLANVPTGTVHVVAYGAAGNVFTATQMRHFGAASSVARSAARRQDGTRDGTDRFVSLMNRAVGQQAEGASRRHYFFNLGTESVILERAANTGTSVLEAAYIATELRNSDGPIAFEASFSPQGSGTGISCHIVVGEGAERRHFMYASSGAVLVRDENNTTIVTLGGNSASREFTWGQTVRIALSVEPNRSGVMTVVPPDGVPRSFAVGSIPRGAVSVGGRCAAGNKIVISDFEWTGTTSILANRSDAPGSAFDPVYLGFNILAPVPGKFLTPTGLDLITRGRWAGCWAVCNDGRQNGAAAFDPQLLIYDPTFANLVHAFDLPYTGASAQGVAIDTSGDADTAWVATSGDGRIIHIELYGSNAGTEISADAIDWSAVGLTGNPNGVAYDPVEGVILACVGDGDTIYKIDCDPATSPRVLQSWAIASGADQLHFDPSRRLLYYSLGANGVNGSVRVLSLSTGADSAAYTALERCQAIEGIYLDRPTQTLTVINDGRFHSEASPALDIATRFKVSLFG